jgi:aldehyde dehydrogenase (NAD+)
MDNTSTEQKIDTLVETQRRYFSSGKTRSIAARRESLNRLERVLMDRKDDLLTALNQDLGKPGVEAYLSEYYFLLQELKLIKKSFKNWLKPQRVSSPAYFQPCRTEIRREAFGATLIMAPWNYPVQLALSPLIAAVAAGNTVILKPSEMATATEKLLVEIIESSFAEEHVAVVTGDALVAGSLLEKSFDFIFFTGSTEIGKIVAAKAAVNLTPTILELGGKCPCIVDASADVEVAARRILAGKFFNGGQTCFAPDFVVVHESVKDRLIAAFERVMASAPWNEEMAHIINDQHYGRLLKFLGGEEVKQGDDDSMKLRLAPRILTQASWGDAVMDEEIFGPILPVLKYSDPADLVQRLSVYGSPLALYLFSNDEGFQQSMMKSIRSGGVCINDTMKQGSQLHTPFGGVGDSGYGRYRGRAGVESMSYQRTVCKRASWAPEFFELMPPYGEKLNWLKRFLR